MITLADGRVFVVGGLDPAYHPLASTELFDPRRETWIPRVVCRLRYGGQQSPWFPPTEHWLQEAARTRMGFAPVSDTALFTPPAP